MQQEYKTLVPDVVHTAEFVDRRSRFLAALTHLSSEAAAEEYIASLRARYHDARHTVFAWILADGRERFSDDGEPSRTAGMPVLDVLHGAGLADVCCVVTRYFGGTLLGPGGLVRAYTAAAQAAVTDAQAASHIVVMGLTTYVTCCIPYAAYDRVLHMAQAAGGKQHEALFTNEVQLTLSFASGSEQPFVAALREFAHGEDLCTIAKPVFTAR